MEELTILSQLDFIEKVILKNKRFDKGYVVFTVERENLVCTLECSLIRIFTVISITLSLPKGQSDPLNSAFRLTYNMVLNLLRLEEINPEYMLEKSFYQFQNYSAMPEMLDSKWICVLYFTSSESIFYALPNTLNRRCRQFERTQAIIYNKSLISLTKYVSLT